MSEEKEFVKLTKEERQEIRAICNAVPAGPWMWGNGTLKTTHSGRLHLMGNARMGMHDAQPTFKEGLYLQPASKIDLNNNPIARFLAHSGEYVPRLLDSLDAEEAENARLRELVEAQKNLIAEHDKRWAHVVREHGVVVAGHHKWVYEARTKVSELNAKGGAQ